MLQQSIKKGSGKNTNSGTCRLAKALGKATVDAGSYNAENIESILGRIASTCLPYLPDANQPSMWVKDKLSERTNNSMNA